MPCTSPIFVRWEGTRSCVELTRHQDVCLLALQHASRDGAFLSTATAGRHRGRPKYVIKCVDQAGAPSGPASSYLPRRHGPQELLPGDVPEFRHPAPSRAGEPDQLPVREYGRKVSSTKAGTIASPDRRTLIGMSVRELAGRKRLPPSSAGASYGRPCRQERGQAGASEPREPLRAPARA